MRVQIFYLRSSLRDSWILQILEIHSIRDELALLQGHLVHRDVQLVHVKVESPIKRIRLLWNCIPNGLHCLHCLHWSRWSLSKWTTEYTRSSDLSMDFVSTYNGICILIRSFCCILVFCDIRHQEMRLLMLMIDYASDRDENNGSCSDLETRPSQYHSLSYPCESRPRSFFLSSMSWRGSAHFGKRVTVNRRTYVCVIVLPSPFRSSGILEYDFSFAPVFSHFHFASCFLKRQATLASNCSLFG